MSAPGNAVSWTDHNQAQANDEGWGVFDNSTSGSVPLYEIERVEDMGAGMTPIFSDDASAIRFVRSAAQHNYPLAQAALNFIAQEQIYNTLYPGMNIHQGLSFNHLMTLRMGYQMLANMAEELAEASVSDSKEPRDVIRNQSHMKTAADIYKLLPRWAKTFGPGPSAIGE